MQMFSTWGKTDEIHWCTPPAFYRSDCIMQLILQMLSTAENAAQHTSELSFEAMVKDIYCISFKQSIFCVW